MDINSYQFHPRQINRTTWETILIYLQCNKNSGSLFIIQTPYFLHEMIFEEFKKNCKNFFVDIESEIVKEEIQIIKPLDKPIVDDIIKQ